MMVPPRGPLQSDQAGPDLGCPRALSGGVVFLYDHSILDVTVGDVPLLDPDDSELGGWT
jgi:hypothetical protein